MPAPNLTVLFNLEPAVEKALATRFTAQLAALPAFVQRDTRELPQHFLGIQFTTGADTGRIHRLPDGTFRPDSWNYTLSLTVQTVRLKGRLDSHGYYRGKVRDILTAARYDPAFLPYHVLSTMQQQAGTESVRMGDDCDLSALTFTGIIGIRTSAWPL